MSNAVKMQTVGEATSSVKGVFESTFSSLAKSLSLPQLKDSFFQNIIYILMVIVILIGILVYTSSITFQKKLYEFMSSRAVKIYLEYI